MNPLRNTTILVPAVSAILGAFVLLTTPAPQGWGLALAAEAPAPSAATGAGPASDPSLFLLDLRLPLHRAAAQGDTVTVKGQLDHGTAIDQMDVWEWTALHVAAIANQAGTAELLLSRGADPNARGYFDLTPLHWAALKGRADLVTLLTRRGAKVEAKSLHGMTPLHLAGTDKTVQALLAAGAKHSSLDNDGMTPLHTARSGDVARALLQAGADIRVASRSKHTPLDFAPIEAPEAVGLSVSARRAPIRLPGANARGSFTLRRVSERALEDVSIVARCDAAEATLSPARIAKLAPGQSADYEVHLQRAPKSGEGTWPIRFTVRARDQELTTFNLWVDTTLGVTLEDEGKIRLGQANLRRAPSRLYYALYGVVPALLAAGYFVARRRGTKRAP